MFVFYYPILFVFLYYHNFMDKDRYFFINFIMKNNFIKSVFILLFGGFITKLLGLLIKIILARYLSSNTLGLYMLILPTFLLCISFSQFGLPIAISKIVAEERRRSKKIFISIFPVFILVHFIMFIIIFFSSNFISTSLLHSPDTYLSIKSISFVILFTSISSFCRSYFFGKGKMFPHVLSNICEDFIRLLLYLFFLPKLHFLSSKYLLLFLILSNIISEAASTFVLLLFLPKKVHFSREDINIDFSILKDCLNISIPNITSSFIGNLTYFLEPIILMHFLLLSGYSSSFITTEYGVLSGYVLPLLLLPSFFTSAISQAIFPKLTKCCKNYQFIEFKKKLKISSLFSLLLVLPIFLLFELFPSFFLSFIYHTTKGVIYLKILAPVFVFLYLNSIISIAIEALGLSKCNFFSTFISSILRIGFLIVSSFFNIGIYSYILSLIVSILSNFLFSSYILFRYLKNI